MKRWLWRLIWICWAIALVALQMDPPGTWPFVVCLILMTAGACIVEMIDAIDEAGDEAPAVRKEQKPDIPTAKIKDRK